MSNYRCGSCGERYTHHEYMDLETVPIDDDEPQYGNESVCENCGSRMHTEKWQRRETVESPDGEEVDVSTTSLLIGHGRSHEQWYETCLFYDSGSSVVERYHTEEDAEQGHEKYIEKIEKGKFHYRTVKGGMVVE